MEMRRGMILEAECGKNQVVGIPDESLLSKVRNSFVFKRGLPSINSADQW